MQCDVISILCRAHYVVCGGAQISQTSVPESGTTCLGHAGAVIAEGQDCTSRHPLKHALMLAIDAAAARDRQLWPMKSKDANTAGASNSKHPQADREAARPDSSIAVGDVSAPGIVCIFTWCMAHSHISLIMLLNKALPLKHV